jgi:hypothetical protein
LLRQLLRGPAVAGTTAEPRRPQIQPDPQAVAAADHNLAEMAHRLEAALRKPKMVEGRAPPPVAPPAPAPENGVDAAAAEAASKPPR